MRKYDYSKTWPRLLTQDIVSLLSQIHEFKGGQNILIAAKFYTFTQLMEIAKIQSTEASNKIEGVFTSVERLRKIVKEKTPPQNRDEQEIAGYRDVLATIHENHNYIPPKPSIILQLHRDLYKFSGLSFGGSYKNSNNIIAEKHQDGSKKTRFEPVEAWETHQAMEALCKAYEDIISVGKADLLLIISMFILDFLCIHPFNDGNGRMSRVLTLLLLYRADYVVGKYISIEKLIEKSKETYYEVLEQSSINWHEGNNNYEPFVKYMLGIIVAAYRDFYARVDNVISKTMSKPDRVRDVIKGTLGKITKREILGKCLDISEVTILRALSDLHQRGDIIKQSGGRYTTYIWNMEKE